MEMLPHKQVHYVSFNYPRSNSQRSKITTPLPVPTVVVIAFIIVDLLIFLRVPEQPRQTCCRFESILDPIKFKTVPLRSDSHTKQGTLTVLLSKNTSSIESSRNRQPSSVVRRRSSSPNNSPRSYSTALLAGKCYRNEYCHYSNV